MYRRRIKQQYFIHDRRFIWPYPLSTLALWKINSDFFFSVFEVQKLHFLNARNRLSSKQYDLFEWKSSSIVLMWWAWWWVSKLMIVSWYQIIISQFYVFLHQALAVVLHITQRLLSYARKIDSLVVLHEANIEND